jgi:hypothetical protein
MLKAQMDIHITPVKKAIGKWQTHIAYLCWILEQLWLHQQEVGRKSWQAHRRTGDQNVKQKSCALGSTHLDQLLVTIALIGQSTSYLLPDTTFYKKKTHMTKRVGQQKPILMGTKRMYPILVNSNWLIYLKSLETCISLEIFLNPMEEPQERLKFSLREWRVL